MTVTKRAGSTRIVEVKGNEEDQILHRACSRVAADSTCH
jgi:hypothetical protein